MAYPQQTQKQQRRLSPSNLITITALTLTLTACGGGGGGGESARDTDPQPQTPPLTGPDSLTQTASLTIPEGESQNQSVEGTIQSSRKVQGDDSITLTEGQSEVTFSVTQLQNEAEARFEVIAENGEETITYFFTVTGQNTSAIPVVNQSDALTKLPASSIAMQDDRRLTEFAVELEYLATTFTFSQKASELQRVLTEYDAISAQAQGALDTLKSTLQSYNGGTATEMDLEQALINAEIAVTDADASNDVPLQDFRDTLSAVGVDFNNDISSDLPLVYDERLQRYTRFTNARLGSYNASGEWTFNSEYDILNEILTIRDTTRSAAIAAN